jgi:nucleoid DNA-binding protein
MLNQKLLANKINIRTKFKYSVKDIETIINNLTEVIIESVASGEDVYIKGLGKLYPKYVKGKMINNAGIPWLAGKSFIIKDRFKLGFSPNKLASKRVEELLTSLKEYATNTK